MTLLVPSGPARRIRDHLAGAYPDEGCGILIGRDGDESREVTLVVEAENTREDSRRNRYLIGPEDFLEADRRARVAGLEVLGFFHSHPDHPPVPSAFDLEHAWPYYSYLIVNVTGGAVGEQRCWRLREDRSGFEAERLEIEPTPRSDAVGVQE